MTQNFVRLATEELDDKYLEYKQRKEEKIIKAEKLEHFSYTIFHGYH